MGERTASDCYCIYCEDQKLNGWCSVSNRWCFLVKGHCSKNAAYLLEKKGKHKHRFRSKFMKVKNSAA